MTISRPSRVVKLYQGEYEARVTEAAERLTKAIEDEQKAGKRFGEKSLSMRVAQEYDDLIAEAEKAAVEVTVHAVGFRHFGALMDQHPPREDNKGDERFDVNMKTFPDELAEMSLADPSTEFGEDDVDAVVKLMRMVGRKRLKELGDISRVHYVKIRDAAWDVNVSSDELPKFSAVSRLRELSETRSKSQSAGESALDV